MRLRSFTYTGTVLSVSLACIGIVFATAPKSLAAQPYGGLAQNTPATLVSDLKQSDGESHSLHGSVSDGTAQAQRPVVVLTFAVQSAPQVTQHRLSNEACPHTDAIDESTDVAPNQEPLTVAPLLLDKLSSAIQEKLSKKTTVTVNTKPEAIPIGALVISGCITRAKPGNSAKRLVGLNYGASRLEAHVVILSKRRTGWLTEDSFDIRVKGGDLFPPLGPIGLGVHAVQDTRQNLSADAVRMAKKVLKRLAKDEKSKRQPEEARAEF